MTARRALLLVLWLWAGSAAAQGGTITYRAIASFPLDAGIGASSAYVVTGGGAAPYAMANAGQDIEVFDATTFLFQSSQPGSFPTFGVADNYLVGTTHTTLVFALDILGTCSVTPCVDAFLWDPTNAFVAQPQALTNGVTLPSAMTVDATMPNLIRVFFTGGAGPYSLFEQDFTVNGAGTGLVASGTVLSRALNPGGSTPIVGLTPDTNPNGFLYLSDAQSLYLVPKDYVKNNASPVYRLAPTGVSVYGLYYQPSAPYHILAASPNPASIGDVFALTVDAGSPIPDAGLNVIVATQLVVAAPGTRDVNPYFASSNAGGTLSVVTETPAFASGITAAWLHIVEGNLLCDGGNCPVLPDGGTDGGGTPPGTPGLPTIPIIPPGTGQVTGTANSCNCSTAGSAPMLLALLLPLLLPRRRR